MKCFLLLISLLLCNGLIGEAQNPQKKNTDTAAEREIREFFDSYAEDLRHHRREAIANRYDSRGYYRMGNGSKTFRSFEETKKRYLTIWSGPKSFEWKDLSIELLSPGNAVVVGLFDWQEANGEKMRYSYTGILVKYSGKWRIRVEDESLSPSGYTTQAIKGNRDSAGTYKFSLTAQPGASIAAHRHSTDMHIKVISGRKFILMGNIATAKVQVFETGASFVIPANTWHVEWWETETVEEIEIISPMRTERAMPSTPRNH